MTVLTAVLAVALGAIAPAQKDLTGDWNVRLSAEWTTFPDLACKLTQKGQALTGSCRAAGDEKGKSVDIAGKVQGNKINCEWKLPTPDGTMWSFVLTGTADQKKSQIKGAFKISSASGAGGAGTFFATRQ